MFNSIIRKNSFAVLLFSFLFAFSIQTIFSAKQPERLSEGYIGSIVSTAYGIAFSDEYNSALYLASNGKTEKLLSAPGCGRYLSVDKTGTKIGFKFIDAASGLQTPAIYDLLNNNIIKLENLTPNAGQVTFADDGTIAYTFENNLIINKNGVKKVFQIGVYSNRAPISPDASKAIFKDDKGQLLVIDLLTGVKKMFTDNKEGYANAVWSPDGKMIAYTTDGIKIYTTELTTGKTFYIGEGENPVFSSNGKELVFFNKDIDFNKVQIVNSDIYIAGVKGEYLKNLTNTADVFEMDPVVDRLSGKILFHTYDKREIRSADVSGLAKQASDVMVKLAEPLKVEFFQNSPALAKPADTKDVPNYVHIHQVYDTREDWGEGRSCCGAASCMEAIASYGILQPSPFYTYSHTSNYGKYISDPYTIGGYTFSGYTDWPSGGHGYLWNGSGSPYSNCVSYLKRHGISSERNESVSFYTVTTELALGYPYIVCSTGLTAGHIVMAVGQYGTGHTLYFNDPYGDKNVGNYGYIRNGKNAIYDWSDANTGRQKVTPVVWAVTARFNSSASPSVFSYWPKDNADSVKSVDTISITFNYMMDKASTEAAFSISPKIDGTIFWTSDDMILNFKPTGTFDKLTKYTVTIANTALSLINRPLDKPISFSFTTRLRDKLAIEKSYPTANQTGINTTAQMKMQFDAPVIYSGLMGKIELYNAKNEKLALANVKVTSSNGKGYLTFEPKTVLEANSYYYILINGKVSDAEGIPLGDNITIPFVTSAEKYMSGTVIDNFENIDNWKVKNLSSGSTGIDTLTSIIALASDKKINGSGSGKLTYSFTKPDGVCRISNSNQPAVGSGSGSEFGVWVYGDFSGNIIDFWFSANGSEQKITADTLNWTGWKLVRVPVSKINGTGTKNFAGVSVTAAGKGSQSGAIYLDDAQYDVVLDIKNENNNVYQMNYSLFQNYPNPFNPSTSISYELGNGGKVSLKVYDILGKEVASLVDGEQSAGRHTVEFSRPLASGIYYYTLRSGVFVSTRKMIILK
jgi:hypothetical protein